MKMMIVAIDSLPFSIFQVNHPLNLVTEAEPCQQSLETISGELCTAIDSALHEPSNEGRGQKGTRVGTDVSERTLPCRHHRKTVARHVT